MLKLLVVYCLLCNIDALSTSVALPLPARFIPSTELLIEGGRFVHDLCINMTREKEKPTKQLIYLYHYRSSVHGWLWLPTFNNNANASTLRYYGPMIHFLINHSNSSH